MADIFVSYARADKARVAPLVAALEAQGWSVWWDPEITPGQEFDTQISAALDAAKAVIVVWTPASVDSRWVRGEAREAADRGVLVPVRFDGARLPIDARAMHTTDLDDWKEDPAGRPFQDLARAIGALLSGASGRRDGGGPAGEIDDLSVAVLPFVNMSSDPEQEYFSDGLSEELLNQLAQLKELRVIGRTSCFAFKGKNEDLRTIGQKLGAAHILEGSVRKAGNRLRITAQLIKCADHSHLWSQTYDRELDDVFAIQDDVARAVAEALKVTLGVGETTLAPGGTHNVEAYDLYLRALALGQQASHSVHQRVAEMMRRAVALDPKFANAWLLLAEALTLLFDYGLEVDRPLRSERDKALDRVVAIAPDLWSGHAARAREQYSELVCGSKGARSKLDGFCVGLLGREEPALAHQLAGAGAGRMNEAVAYLLLIREADPLRPLPVLQFFLVIAGRYAEADTEYARSKDAAPGPLQLADWFAFSQTLATKDRASAKQSLASLVASGAALAVFNDELLTVFDDSDAVVAWIRRKLSDPSPEIEAVTVLFAFLAAYFGAHDYALQLLRRHFVELAQSTPILNIWHPLFADTRKLPGFKDFVRELGVYDYWRESGKWGDFARPLGDDDFEIIR